MRNAKRGMRNSGSSRLEVYLGIYDRHPRKSEIRNPKSQIVTSHILIAYIKSVMFDYKSSLPKNNLPMATSPSDGKRKQRSHQVYLGVDGGGTKTQIAVMNEAREITCEGFAGPSNPLRVGVETAVTNIAKAVNEACDRGGVSRGDIAFATL